MSDSLRFCRTSVAASPSSSSFVDMLLSPHSGDHDGCQRRELQAMERTELLLKKEVVRLLPLQILVVLFRDIV